MLDTRLDDWLCRIDTITNRLAASNCGTTEPLSAEQETTLLLELHHLNTRVDSWFAVFFGCGKQRTPRQVTQVFGAACAGLVLLLVMGILVMAFATVMQDLATSFSMMARPVP